MLIAGQFIVIVLKYNIIFYIFILTFANMLIFVKDKSLNSII